MSPVSPQQTGERIVRLVKLMAVLALFSLISMGSYAGWSARLLYDKREKWFAEQRYLLNTVSANRRMINSGYEDFKDILLWYQPQTLQDPWLDNLLRSVLSLEAHSTDGEVKEVKQVLSEFKTSMDNVRKLRLRSIVWGKRYRDLLEDFEAGRSLGKARLMVDDLRRALETLQGEQALRVSAQVFQYRRQSGEPAQNIARKLMEADLESRLTYYTTITGELAELAYQIERLAAEFNADSLVDIKDNVLRPTLRRLQKAIRLTLQDQKDQTRVVENLLSDLGKAILGNDYQVDEALQSLHLGEGGLFALRKEFLQLTNQRDWILIAVDEAFSGLTALNNRIIDAFGGLFETIIQKDRSAMHRLWSHLLIIGTVFLVFFIVIAILTTREASRQVAALHAGREHLLSIMNSMLDGLITIDNRGRVESVNPAAKVIFDISQEKIIGDPVEILIPDLSIQMKDSPGYAPHLRQEATGRRQDGTPFPLELSLTRIPMTQQPLYSVIIRDITDQKRFEDKLRQMAIHDPLTGLFNRGEGMRVLEEEIERAGRYHRPLSVIMLDIDHFKRINDTYGHGVGDKVLCGTANQLEKLVRTSDTVARYGGEEMLIVLPETGLGEALLLAERLREGVAANRVRQENGESISVSASLGVASYPAQGSSLEAVLAAADQALYKAKADGRNRVRGSA
jgi:diguanylate cyclase (GGDEF)-like protein/PAS domain S-box-containing protein